MPKPLKPEAQFERDLAYYAPLKKCKYIKIPDPKGINKDNRTTHREKKRPFDGILYTSINSWSVECKVDYNTLEPHQAKNQHEINEINNSFLVLRWMKSRKAKAYQVIRTGKKIYEGDILDMLDFLKGLE